MKKLMIAAFCLFLSVPAMATGWTNWFTIDSLKFVYDGVESASSQSGSLIIIPVGTVENTVSCSTTDGYLRSDIAPSSTTGDASNRLAFDKLATLAYTAGWQARVYLSDCQYNRPRFKALEIKKP